MYGAIVVLWLGSEPELTERRADLAVWATELGLGPGRP